MRARRSTVGIRTGALALLVALFPSAPALRAQPETTVGMVGTFEAVVLPGTELEAKPLDDRKSPVVLRVARVYPHGTAFRYDLEYTGLEPGTHDLRAYLRRKDGTPVGELPPLPVKVAATLPAGQIQPHKLEIEPGPRVGGYQVLVIAVAAAWVFGLLALVASFFFPRRRTALGTSDKPVSLAERLRPLLEGAVAGTLSRAELAGLERGLLAYWRKRLKLEDADPAAAHDRLRGHPEAGPLLARLEEWLHHPGPPGPVDVPALLAPYRGLPPEAIDLAGGPSA
ncbi:MAG TPA: hypothetical protein VH092_12875 [Urbifossiella sp.]|jgi:hypothetical protein|nr:hypothetical protein [Urbifossiella sp.]